jgi:hypothetical protein
MRHRVSERQGDAKMSKSPIWVNEKIAEYVPISGLGQQSRNEKYIQTSVTGRRTKPLRGGLC